MLPDDSMLLGCVGLLIALLSLFDGSSAGAPPHADSNVDRSKGSVIAAKVFTCVYINKHLLKNYICIVLVGVVTAPEVLMFSTFWCKYYYDYSFL